MVVRVSSICRYVRLARATLFNWVGFLTSVAGCAEKVLLNGFAAYITQPAGQITFALLTSAILLIVQVHFNPYKEADASLLAKLLTVATFLTLLLGAHVQLTGDAEATAATLAVQAAIMGCIAVFVGAATCIIAYGVWQPMHRVHAAHQAMRRGKSSSGASASTSSGTKATSRARHVARSVARVVTAARTKFPAVPRLPSRNKRVTLPKAPPPGSEAALATDACVWVLHECCPVDERPLPAVALTTLRQELRGRFGSMMVGSASPHEWIEYHLAAMADRNVQPLPVPNLPSALRKPAADCVQVVRTAADVLPATANPLLQRASASGERRQLDAEREAKLDRLLLMHARSAAEGSGSSNGSRNGSGNGHSSRGRRHRPRGKGARRMPMRTAAKPGR